MSELKQRIARAKEIAETYRREEDGAIIAFSLFMFIAMIMIAGLAFDIMLYENDRTHIQNSTDRAVLAAANLDQSVDPKVVVQDYLAKVGIEIDQDDVSVVQQGSFPVITGRQVSVSIEADRPTVFMRDSGVFSLPLQAFSEASEAINDIEVSLVLDVSGSMSQTSSAGGTKLAALQDAATDFVEKILDGAGTVDDRVSLSLVPYSTQVSLGPDLMAQMNINSNHDHDYSYCVNFNNDTDFETTAIDLSATMSQEAHFDPWSWYGWGKSIFWPVCRGNVEANGDRNDEDFHIQPWSNNVTALTEQIDGLTAEGNTSIDLAMKWGTALLDPSMQSVLSAMATPSTGDVNSAFNGRPFSHTRDDTLKFIVLMTDGINTTQYYMKDSYKNGLSNVYVDSETGRYTFDHSENGNEDGDGIDDEEYYWLYHTYYDSDEEENVTLNAEWQNEIYDHDGNGSDSIAVRLDWVDVWAEMNLSWRAYNFYYRQTWNANHYYNNIRNVRGYFNATKKDTRLDKICTAAKDAGIVVFTVGFEVTDSSASVMESCASTPSHFYRVDGSEIEYAFASIANQINQLKLTQ